MRCFDVRRRWALSICTILFLLASTEASWCQDVPALPVWGQIDGPFVNGVGLVGVAVVVPGDIDGDGTTDFVLSATDDPFLQGNEIRAVSGLDFSTIYSLVSNPGEGIGGWMGLVGDIDLDGFPDFASLDAQPSPIGGFNRDVVIRSGATGQALYTISGVSQETTAFCELGDVNGDGASEFVVGDWGFNAAAGPVTVRDGATGTVLQTIASLGNGFGIELRALGDINGDGFGDFSVGSGETSSQPVGAGNAFLFTSSSAGLPYQLSQQYFQLSHGVRAGKVQDVDGDGCDDYAVGYANPCFPSYPTAPVGGLELHSGFDHSVLWAVPSPSGTTVGFTHGGGPVPVGDIDGDGVTEIANVAFVDDFGGGLFGPRIYIFSGVDGRVLFRCDGDAGPVPTCTGGFQLDFSYNMGTGDFDGDGLGDLLVSNAGANNNLGYVRIYRGTTLFDPQAAAGNVTPLLPGGTTADVLRMGVSGSGAPSAGGAARSVFFGVGDDLAVWMARPPLNPGLPTPFAIFGKGMTGGDHTTQALPFGVGSMCFTPEFLDPLGPEPLFTLMNTFGGAPALLPGSLAFFGAPGHQVWHTGPFPFPAEFWLQGLIADTQKSWPQVSVTNALRVVVRCLSPPPPSRVGRGKAVQRGLAPSAAISRRTFSRRALVFRTPSVSDRRLPSNSIPMWPW